MMDNNTAFHRMTKEQHRKALKFDAWEGVEGISIKQAVEVLESAKRKMYTVEDVPDDGFWNYSDSKYYICYAIREYMLESMYSPQAARVLQELKTYVNEALGIFYGQTIHMYLRTNHDLHEAVYTKKEQIQCRQDVLQYLIADLKHRELKRLYLARMV